MSVSRSDHLPLEPKICAWCDTPMGVETPRRARSEQRPNHGLCPDCTEQLLDSLLSDAAAPERLSWRHPPRRRVTRLVSAR